MKRFSLGLALLGLASPLFAQNQDDALRYSRLQPSGTARTLSIGGASTALGADLGTLVTNPAGLGLFQRSDFTISPALGLNSANARVGNADGATSLNDSRNSLHFANLAVAFASRRPDSDNNDWRGGTLAFGLTRINDFNNHFAYRSNLPDRRSLFQRFREPRLEPGQSVRGLFDDVEDQFANGYYSLDGLAYGNYLTNYDPPQNPSGDYSVSTPGALQRGTITQEGTVQTSGSQTQFDIGYGGSYRDRLYVGGAIGIVGTRFNSFDELRESNDTNTNSAFGSLVQRNELRTRGSGLNARLGLIYRPMDWLRVGVSAQSPTAFQLNDTYTLSLTSQFRQPLNVGGGQTVSSASASTEETPYAYRLTTPWRVNGGAAVVLGKFGFLTADAELVDYSQARLRNDPQLQNGDDVPFTAENNQISRQYASAINLRAGGEARLGAFRVRAGYARYGDPFNNSQFDRTQEYYTGGLGLRQGNFTADLAGVLTRYNGVYSPYTLADGSQPEVRMDATRILSTFTLGYQF